MNIMNYLIRYISLYSYYIKNLIIIYSYYSSKIIGHVYEIKSLTENIYFSNGDNIYNL